jgi:hypothetical protein
MNRVSKWLGYLCQQGPRDQFKFNTYGSTVALGVAHSKLEIIEEFSAAVIEEFV